VDDNGRCISAYLKPKGGSCSLDNIYRGDETNEWGQALAPTLQGNDAVGLSRFTIVSSISEMKNRLNELFQNPEGEILHFLPDVKESTIESLDISGKQKKKLLDIWKWIHKKNFISVTVVNRHEVDLPKSATSLTGARLSIAENNSMVRVEKGDKSIWVALEETITGRDDLYGFGEMGIPKKANAVETANSTADQEPCPISDFSAGYQALEFIQSCLSPDIQSGGVGIMASPQHGVFDTGFRIRRDGIIESYFDYNYGKTDQDHFYGADLWGGNYFGPQPYEGMRRFRWTGGNIQTYRSALYASINSGTPVMRNMRLAQQVYGLWDKELEHQYGYYLHLNEYSDIVEDYSESRGLLWNNGLATLFSPTITARGKLPDKIKQLIEQRLRWESSLELGLKRILPNVIRDAQNYAGYLRGTSDRITQYSGKQGLIEALGCTWYYAGAFRYARALAPMMYFMGVYSYAADANIFPGLTWALLGTTIPAYLFSMFKEGEKLTNLMVKTPGIFSYLSTGLTEKMLPAARPRSWQALMKILDEGAGPFVLTDQVGGALAPRYMVIQELAFALSLAAGVAGVSEII
ncbi:MAG: hypothetical protein AABZ57_03625, partial [Candidatus Margulisiibacteriota bacterium]